MSKFFSIWLVGLIALALVSVLFISFNQPKPNYGWVEMESPVPECKLYTKKERGKTRIYLSVGEACKMK